MPTSPPPPLAWLRAFEAASRLGSFRAAADDLSVTPSTISHQVRDLESRLGVLLFARSGRGLALTREGRGYARALRAGFDLIRNAEIPGRRGNRLRIGAFPFVVSEVLVPNLASLHLRLPDAELSLHSETHLTSLCSSDPEGRVDAIIRYGAGGFPGYLSLKISDVTIAPIVASNAMPVERAADVLDMPVIRVRGAFDGWRRWAAAMAVPGPPPHTALETDSYHAATLAVERGVGVGLGILPFVRPWISDQRITIMEELAAPVEAASYLVYAPYREHDPKIAVFHEWLLDILGLNAATGRRCTEPTPDQVVNGG